MTKLIRNGLIAGIALFIPHGVDAATNCRIVDFEDHVELVCIGDEKYVPSSGPSALPVVRNLAHVHNLSSASKSSTERTPVPTTLEQKKPDSLLAFQLYMQSDRKRVADFTGKKAFRQKSIQDEQKRHPSPPATDIPQTIDPE